MRGLNGNAKTGPSLAEKRARVIVEDFSYWCVKTTPAQIRRAFEIEDEARIGFWDALIVAAAVCAGATRILSEDLNPGQTIARDSNREPLRLPAQWRKLDAGPSASLRGLSA